MKAFRLIAVTLLLLLSAQSLFAGRYYDSKTGRFLTVDPLAHKFPGVSPYAYCMNNPLTNIDPDGKEPITLTGVATAGAALLGSAAVIYGSYKAIEYSVQNNSGMPSQMEMTLSIVNTGINLWEGVTGLFTSGEATAPTEGEQGTSVGEQAGELSEQAGKNSITLPDGTRVDLKGRGHTDKTTGDKVDTPHTHEAESHTNPKTGETFTKTKKVPRPTTQEDLDKVKNILK